MRKSYVAQGVRAEDQMCDLRAYSGYAQRPERWSRSRHLGDHLDFDRRAQRQLGHADRAARVPTLLAEYRSDFPRHGAGWARSPNLASDAAVNSTDLILVILFVVVLALFWLFVWWNRE